MPIDTCNSESPPELNEFLAHTEALPWARVVEEDDIGLVWQPGLVFLRVGRVGARVRPGGNLEGFVNNDVEPENAVLKFGVDSSMVTHRVYVGTEHPLAVEEHERITAIQETSTEWLQLTRQYKTALEVQRQAEEFRNSVRRLALEPDSKLAGLVEEVIQEAVSQVNPARRKALEERLDSLGVAVIEDWQEWNEGGAYQPVTFASRRLTTPDCQFVPNDPNQ